MSKFISIILPGIRPARWKEFYDSIRPSLLDYEFELIIVGPHKPSQEMSAKPEVKYIEDYGAPARAAQIGTIIAQGDLMTWASDDGVYLPGALAACVDLFEDADYRQILTVQYCEGPGRTGVQQPDWYWIARSHADQQLPGVKASYRCAPVAMLNLAFFRHIGGWDCRYEHLNMCNHDLAFRVQNAGGRVVMSPGLVLSCDWNITSNEAQPILQAYLENDKKLFTEMYSVDQTDRIQIDFNNWTQAPAVWLRRWESPNVKAFDNRG